MFLEVNNLTVCYDTAMVLDSVNMNVDSGELVGLVGPNGAGKSTLLRAISGLMHWEKQITKGMRKEVANIVFEGSVVFDGERIEKLSAPKIASRGLVLCPERAKVFRELTVAENLMIGGYLNKDKNETLKNMQRVWELMPVLKERGKQVAGTLSGGQKLMLAIGRVLMYKPRLLCIDEPSVGLAPIVKEEVFGRIKEIHQLGITVLLVEQDISLAFDISNRNYVLSKGKIAAEGQAKDLLANEVIRKTFLGLS